MRWNQVTTQRWQPTVGSFCVSFVSPRRQALLCSSLLPPLSQLMDDSSSSCRRSVHRVLNRLALLPAGALGTPDSVRRFEEEIWSKFSSVLFEFGNHNSVWQQLIHWTILRLQNYVLNIIKVVFLLFHIIYRFPTKHFKLQNVFQLICVSTWEGSSKIYLKIVLKSRAVSTAWLVVH